MPTLKTFLRLLLAVALVIGVFFAWKWYQSSSVQPAQIATGATAQAQAATPAASAPTASAASAPTTPVAKCECECPKKPVSQPKGQKGPRKPPSVEKPPVATPQPPAVQPAPQVAPSALPIFPPRKPYEVIIPDAVQPVVYGCVKSNGKDCK